MRTDDRTNASVVYKLTDDHGRVLLDVIGGRTSAAEAVRTGLIAIDGRPADLELFARLFRSTAAPSPQEGIVVH
ncbi:hypothetical protein [Amycolatopsis sp. NPDC003861]